MNQLFVQIDDVDAATVGDLGAATLGDLGAPTGDNLGKAMGCIIWCSNGDSLGQTTMGGIDTASALPLYPFAPTSRDRTCL